MKNKIIVIDDKRAGRLARELGLEVIGALSILKKLHREGALVETPNTVFRRLIEIGILRRQEVIRQVFKEDNT